MTQPAEQQMTLGEALQLAIQCHQMNNLSAAEKMYERILAAEPQQVDAMHLLGVIREEQGRFAEAIDLIQKSLQLSPDNPEAQNNLSIALQQAGRTQEAYEASQRAIALDPAYAQAHYNLGALSRILGKQEEAMQAYQKAIALYPGYTAAYYNLGNIYREKGNLKEARAQYENALTLEPRYAEAHNNLGVICHAEHQLPQAITHFRAAIDIKPTFAEAWSNLGKSLKEDGQEEEMLLCYHKAMTLIDPANAEARAKLAESLRAQGKQLEALVEYQRAFVLREPNNPQMHMNLGDALTKAKNYEEAIACYTKAIELNPHFAHAHNNLGVALYKAGQQEEAMVHYENAVAIQPDYPDALLNLALAYEDHGELERALGFYQRLTELAPNPCIDLHVATMCNPMPMSRAQIEESRRSVNKALDTLARRHLTIEDPYTQMGQTNFGFAYHGENDREITSKIADIFLKACPAMGWKAPHCDRYATMPRREKLRVGIISAFLFNHTIARFNAGIIKYLPREQCEVIVFRSAENIDETAKAIDASADKTVVLPSHLRKARSLIADEELDVLFYTDIGMDTFTYFLAFARLAPVQCVTWGHPDTTGVPNIDYFLSSRLLEPEGAQDHYSEQLILLNELPTYYFRPSLPKQRLVRSYFGLPQDATLYACPQSLFKFHPDFDATLAEILRRDPKGKLVLIHGLYSRWNDVLLERLRQLLPDADERIVFIPRVNRPDFLNLLLVADVILDPPFFGGGNTSYESFAMGMPIVTWPGPYMRGRVTAACYQKMGMTDLIAHSKEEYVELAYRLATDAAWRDAMKEKVRNLAPVLYDRKEMVEELATFFRAATDAAREGRKLTNWD